MNKIFEISIDPRYSQLLIDTFKKQGIEKADSLSTNSIAFVGGAKDVGVMWATLGELSYRHWFTPSTVSKIYWHETNRGISEDWYVKMCNDGFGGWQPSEKNTACVPNNTKHTAF